MDLPQDLDVRQLHNNCTHCRRSVDTVQVAREGSVSFNDAVNCHDQIASVI
jgi:hypothetical protein